ncbi:MAG TPA: hypothetical protein VFB01_10330 [Burkholderiales bacterium]|jgi:hypothetical protein|nr:hypothetical protein [Burkholderiales bacterium]
MDRTLLVEDVTWLRAMRDAQHASIPLHVAMKLRLRGYAVPNGQSYTITLKGRDELVDRERESLFG